MIKKTKELTTLKALGSIKVKTRVLVPRALKQRQFLNAFVLIDFILKIRKWGQYDPVYPITGWWWQIGWYLFGEAGMANCLPFIFISFLAKKETKQRKMLRAELAPATPLLEQHPANMESFVDASRTPNQGAIWGITG